ncbi:MAG: phage tail assembly chaperone [Ancalomicrobiaceae bacterium]|nr:phage tail assembly chaperone [Ancalomicrobiaceae bacterium]
MSPAAFWSMTLPEFFAAMDGHLEANGVKRGSRGGAPSKDEADELFALPVKEVSPHV